MRCFAYENGAAGAIPNAELDGCAFIEAIRQLPREQGGDTRAIALTV